MFIGDLQERERDEREREREQKSVSLNVSNFPRENVQRNLIAVFKMFYIFFVQINFYGYIVCLRFCEPLVERILPWSTWADVFSLSQVI